MMDVVDDILLKMSRDANAAVPSSAPPRVLKSIANYKSWRPTHGKNSGVSIDAIREFRTDIFLKPINRLLLKRILVDDQCKTHACSLF